MYKEIRKIYELFVSTLRQLSSSKYVSVVPKIFLSVTVLHANRISDTIPRLDFGTFTGILREIMLKRKKSMLVGICMHAKSVKLLLTKTSLRTNVEQQKI